MNEIRFNLDDIIEGNLIDDVLVSLDMTSRKKMFNRIVFWRNGKVTTTQLNNFMKAVDKKLNHEIKIDITDRKPQSEYVWFDVVSDIIESNKCRFSYIYPSHKKSNIILGIHSFYNVMDFVEKSRGKRIVYKKDNQNGSRRD